MHLYRAISTSFFLQKGVTGACQKTLPSTSLTYDDVTSSCSSGSQDIAAFREQQVGWQEFQDCPRDLPVFWGPGAQYAFHCHLYNVDKNKLSLFFQSKRLSNKLQSWKQSYKKLK